MAARESRADGRTPSLPRESSIITVHSKRSCPALPERSPVTVYTSTRRPMLIRPRESGHWTARRSLPELSLVTCTCPVPASPVGIQSCHPLNPLAQPSHWAPRADGLVPKAAFSQANLSSTCHRKSLPLQDLLPSPYPALCLEVAGLNSGFLSPCSKAFSAALLPAG